MFIKIIESMINKSYNMYIIAGLFFMLAMMFIDAYIHLPKQKFISSICDKIIREAKKSN